MQLSPRLGCFVKKFGKISYVKNYPDGFKQVAKKTIPIKVYGNRFGTPDLIRWKLHPLQYQETMDRPWTRRSATHQESGVDDREIRWTQKRAKKIPVDEWFIFMGDRVKVLAGKDKGKTGIVIQIHRELNLVWVEGLNFGHSEEDKKMGVSRSEAQEQPFDVGKNEIALVDDHNEIVKPVWRQDKDGKIIRVDAVSGYVIEFNQLWRQTQQYNDPSKYQEKKKDTPAKISLKVTYELSPETFEEELMKQYNIQIEPEPANVKTYFY